LRNEERGENNPLWLEEGGGQPWERDSQDENGGVMHFRVELLGLCSLFGMVICNGMRRWPTSGGITCKTYNGQSVVDCVICSQSFTSRLLKFLQQENEFLKAEIQAYKQELIIAREAYEK